MTPLYFSPIYAGFPGIVEEVVEKKLDLNEFLIKNPEATYFLRVSGDSMVGAGIYNGDLLIVDRSQAVKSGDIIIASINGEFTVKRLEKKGDRFLLLPENSRYKSMMIHEEDDFLSWGKVIYVIHQAI
ncbi:MAG: translesion error-prone DNA polymerase V autoproteolytic subunit [Candidatus Dojkabacteria bacterium]|nr:MAG: translesion error-prone DNA polymerase V autoproteolytic subunit [Candidatus Dojkabacteria bacterium]